MAAGLTRAGDGRRRWRRRGAGLLLLLAVVGVHGWLSERLAEQRVGWGAADSAPARFEVEFVRELAQAEPPAQAPRPVPRRVLRRKPAPPAAAASQPAPVAEPAASAPAPQPTGEPVPEPMPPDAALASADAAASAASAASEASAAGAASAPEAAASAAGPAFEWPPSTRLSYGLTGYYQGPVEGSARVQWIRQGERYQVHLDVTIGMSVAPLMTRRMTSDGELGEHGLTPLRYDEHTEVAFKPARHLTMRFEDGEVVLANGSRQPRPPGVQDTASQFVQMTWLFTTQPQLLQSGRTIELPLALPKRVDRWTYDVLEADTLYTPFGEVPVMHVKPRRLDRPGGEMTVECWFAPSLQYLPVRIRIHQNAETYVDLVLERPPQQAAP